MKGQTLRGHIQEMLGDLGLSGIRIGSKTIKASPRESLQALKGFGDTIKVGDIVEVTHTYGDKLWINPVPQKITLLTEGLHGPGVAYRDFDDGPIHQQRSTPLTSVPDFLSFRLLTNTDIVAWFDSHRRLADGWHKVDRFIGRVLVENGVPTQVQRVHSEMQMAYVVEMAGQISGFTLEVSRTYSDAAKTLAIVKKATRRVFDQ